MPRTANAFNFSKHRESCFQKRQVQPAFSSQMPSTHIDLASNLRQRNQEHSWQARQTPLMSATVAPC
ncbi:hypothetical protein Hypma_013912 [Hypsizygus marmoreus]|uniref:Uncharacterized protein n=1 Tax=Hypsizygus marmoreus TaxID=39966 RepID=A0A369K916_HYPMA|nr:hypothetical protein Hypma_013912 [Hypsizygus marmoreus]